MSHLKILGARSVTWRRFHSEDLLVLGNTEQNVVLTANWRPRFVHPCNHIFLWISCTPDQRLGVWVAHPVNWSPVEMPKRWSLDYRDEDDDTNGLWYTDARDTKCIHATPKGIRRFWGHRHRQNITKMNLKEEDVTARYEFIRLKNWGSVTSSCNHANEASYSVKYG
jgi:hypothetical protein